MSSATTIRSIALPTAFDEGGEQAFLHALALALEHRSRLYLLHVRPEGKGKQWKKFPGVREVLERWGVLPEDSEISDIERLTGVTVRKVDIVDKDAGEGLVHFFTEHRPDLIVMATHGKTGLARILSGSVAAELASKTQIPTLLFGPEATSFIDESTGALTLKRVALPIDNSPPAGPALGRMQEVFPSDDLRWEPFHIGDNPPQLSDSSGQLGAIQLLSGNVVEVIVRQGKTAGVIAMPTAGRHGFLDAIRGSTTERVVHDAPCPVLAVYSG